MFGNKRLPAAFFAGGLAALVALAGCEREPRVASKSPAAQIQGEAAGGGEHSHAHGAVAPGSAAPEATSSGHDHGEAGAAAPDHSAMDHGSEAHAGHAPRQGESAAPQAGGHAGHAGMDHGEGHAAPERTGGAAEQDEHAGHVAMPPQTPPAGGQPPSGGHAGHAGQAPAQGSMAPATAVAAPVAVPPGQPAATLRPDPLDAPAATSVLDAQRSAEIAEEMTGGGHGGHGGHGGGTYRHVDAGRGPGAYEGSEEQTPGAGAHQHDHGPATPPPSGEEGDHSQHEPPGGAAQDTAAVYTCPMHPEVTSRTPGKCPKCGMTLVKRRKG